MDLAQHDVPPVTVEGIREVQLEEDALGVLEVGARRVDRALGASLRSEPELTRLEEIRQSLPLAPQQDFGREPTVDASDCNRAEITRRLPGCH